MVSKQVSKDVQTKLNLTTASDSLLSFNMFPFHYTVLSKRILISQNHYYRFMEIIPALAGTLWGISVEHIFTARRTLLMVTSASGLGRTCYSSHQWCYLHRLCNLTYITKANMNPDLCFHPKYRIKLPQQATEIIPQSRIYYHKVGLVRRRRQLTAVVRCDCRRENWWRLVPETELNVAVNVNTHHSHF